MTAAVPDRRFRDQLAEALRSEAHWCDEGPCPCVYVPRDEPIIWASAKNAESVTEIQADPDVIVAFLLPLIAAEVEACVQAAANQRAAEELLKLGDDLADTFYAGKPLINGYAHRRVRARAATLASPTPAPHAEEGDGDAHA